MTSTIILQREFNLNTLPAICAWSEQVIVREKYDSQPFASLGEYQT